MSDTKLLDAQEHYPVVWGSSLASAVKGVQKYLVVQPKPDALATAQAALLPLLFAAGQEIWNPLVLRHDGLPSTSAVRYRLAFEDGAVLIDVWAVGEQLHRSPAKDRLPAGALWGLRTNGSDWQLMDFSQGAPVVWAVSLFDDSFPEFAGLLLSPGPQHSLEGRLSEARNLLRAKTVEDKLERLIAKLGIAEVRARLGDKPEALETLLREEGLLAENETLTFDATYVQQAVQTNLHATQLGFVRAAPPLAHISLQDVRRHGEAVKNLKGHLSVSFDKQPVDIRSRSAYYYVLAALAVQYGREDLIPSELLTRPPDKPAVELRTRALGRPGWHLTLPAELSTLEQAVNQFLDNLNLRQRFEALQRGKPYPASKQY